jgi:hypothetical protein
MARKYCGGRPPTEHQAPERELLSGLQSGIPVTGGGLKFLEGPRPKLLPLPAHIHSDRPLPVCVTIISHELAGLYPATIGQLDATISAVPLEQSEWGNASIETC